METEEAVTVRDLLERLKVPFDSVKIIFVNGVRSDLSTTLADGDRVGVFPPVAGG
jgi:molybdopterin converting factor small subunit